MSTWPSNPDAIFMKVCGEMDSDSLVNHMWMHHPTGPNDLLSEVEGAKWQPPTRKMMLFLKNKTLGDCLLGWAFGPLGKCWLACTRQARGKSQIRIGKTSESGQADIIDGLSPPQANC
jgi:hypothetical protein